MAISRLVTFKGGPLDGQRKRVEFAGAEYVVPFVEMCNWGHDIVNTRCPMHFGEHRYRPTSPRTYEWFSASTVLIDPDAR